jgi:MFS family permease
MVVRAMCAITLFVGAMALARSPWHLLVLRVGQGLFSGFIAPSITLVSIGAPAGRQGRIAGTLQTAVEAGAVAGPLLGGVLSAAVGIRAVYAAVAALSALSALLVHLLAREDRAHLRRADGEATLRRVLRGTHGDVLELLRSRTFRALLVLTFAMKLGLGATNPLLELLVGDLVAGSADLERQATGALFSAMAAFNLVGLPLWGRYGDRVGHDRALVRAAAWTALALVAHALAPTYAWLLAARAVLGASMAGAVPAGFGLAAASIPIERRGGAFGALFSAHTLAMSVSALIGGWACRYVGIQGLFLIGAALVVLPLAGLRRRA